MCFDFSWCMLSHELIILNTKGIPTGMPFLFGILIYPTNCHGRDPMIGSELEKGDGGR